MGSLKQYWAPPEEGEGEEHLRVDWVEGEELRAGVGVQEEEAEHRAEQEVGVEHREEGAEHLGDQGEEGEHQRPLELEELSINLLHRHL